MKHFHSLRVSRVEKETDDCVTVEFEVPDDLKEVFSFIQGQSLTMRKNLEGAEQRRTYSICSSPYDNQLRVAIKKVDGGIFSTWANDDLKEGEYLDVMAPVGNFYTRLDPRQKKNYLAFAAGSGITPVLSLIKTSLRAEPASSFTLVYGNRTKNSIIFREELESLKDKYLDRFRIYHVLSRERTETQINSGRIDREKLELLSGRVLDYGSFDEFFLCGPEQLIFCVRDFLAEQGISHEKIHFELFTIPGQKRSTVPDKAIPEMDSGPKSGITVKLDGIMFDFDLSLNGPSILDGALKRGADLPYACKGGVCTTCKARLVSGEVKMDVNWGLEQDELDAGFILTCQSHPVTDRVVVDFDVK